MKWFRFYGRCLRHATAWTWVVLGAISTVATYIPAFAAKGFGVVDLDMNAIIFFSFPIAVILCFILVPFREAFKLYQEKERELQEKEAEIRRITALTQFDKPVRLAAHQLWDLFSRDPIGSQSRLRTVQLSGMILSSGKTKNGYEVRLNAEAPQAPAWDLARSGYPMVANIRGRRQDDRAIAAELAVVDAAAGVDGLEWVGSRARPPGRHCRRGFLGVAAECGAARV
jgi:hypothetical protein